MKKHPLPERAQNFTPAHLGSVDDQIRTLVTLLLERLLDEIGDIRHAAVQLQPGGDAATGEPFARVDRAPDAPDDPGTEQLELSTQLADGTCAVLEIGAGHDADRAWDVARRYLSAIGLSLNLLTLLQTERDKAQDAVRAVESTALLDLATGVLMARQPMDPRSARTALQAWCERTGTQLEDLSPEAVLDLLTVEEI